MSYVNFYALRFHSSHNCLLGLGDSFVQLRLPKLFRRIRNENKCHNREYFFDTKCTQYVSLGKFTSAKTIVIHKVNTDLDKAINLVADTQSTRLIKIIIDSLGRSKTAAIDLFKLKNCDAHGSRGKGRHIAIKNHLQTRYFTLLR